MRACTTKRTHGGSPPIGLPGSVPKPTPTASPGWSPGRSRRVRRVRRSRRVDDASVATSLRCSPGASRTNCGSCSGVVDLRCRRPSCQRPTIEAGDRPGSLSVGRQPARIPRTFRTALGPYDRGVRHSPVILLASVVVLIGCTGTGSRSVSSPAPTGTASTTTVPSSSSSRRRRRRRRRAGAWRWHSRSWRARQRSGWRAPIIPSSRVNFLLRPSQRDCGSTQTGGSRCLARRDGRAVPW